MRDELNVGWVVTHREQAGSTHPTADRVAVSRSFNPARQRFDALDPGLHRRRVFEVEAAFRRDLHVRIAREVGDRRPPEREAVPAVALVLLDIAG